MMIFPEIQRQINNSSQLWDCLFSRSNFLLINIIQNYKFMRTMLIALTVLLMASSVFTQSSSTTLFNLKPVKRGFTMQATKFPTYESSWTGRFSCNNCNPFEGDQLCNKSLPLVCITHAKKLHRPLYDIAVEYTPFAILDGGYYQGWTGGVIQVTLPVRGFDLVDFNTGDKLCKGYFGPEAKWAKFNDGYYMDFMNQRPWKVMNHWRWTLTKQGGWNFWGYFNHHYRGRAWVWVDNQPFGNCGR